jgi:hypothetical protein
MPVDHEKAFEMFWELDDWHWLNQAPLTDHVGIGKIFRRFAGKLEEDYRSLEMLRRGNTALARERDAAFKEIERLKAYLDAERMEICAHEADTVEDQRQYAKQRGWDCFPEEATDAQ